MSALAMSLIISAHATHGLRDGKHVCHATGCPWVYSGNAYPSSQTVSEHVGEVLSAAGFGPVREARIEWGVAFTETGAFYKSYSSRDEAREFVDSMNEVDANMMVVKRQYTPAIYGIWTPEERKEQDA